MEECVLMSSLFAYIDPVSGTLILQFLIAGIVGVAAFFWKPVKRLLNIGSPSKEEHEVNNSDNN